MVLIFSCLSLENSRENAIQPTEDAIGENRHWDVVQRAMLPHGWGDLHATKEARHECILANSALHSNVVVARLCRDCFWSLLKTHSLKSLLSFGLERFYVLKQTNFYVNRATYTF